MPGTRPCAALRRTDDGFALITVLGAMTVVTLFLLSSLAYALNNTGPSREDQDAKAALAAAQAGIAEFSSRLSLDDTYYANNGGVHSGNPAFTREVPVQGTGGAAARYSYRLLTTAAETGINGMIRLAVIGCSTPRPVSGSSNPYPCRAAGGTERELVADYRPDGFLSYIYFTDYESADPTLLMGPDAVGVGDPPVFEWFISGTGNNQRTRVTYRVTAETQRDICRTHYYAGRHLLVFSAGRYVEVRQPQTRQGTNSPWENNGTATETTLEASTTTRMHFAARACTEISFTGLDDVAGLAHSNDAFRITGPVRFRNRTTSAWGDPSTLPALKPGMTALPPPTDGRLWWGDKTLALPAELPQYGRPIPLPISNAAIRAKADPAQAGPGCLYVGQTRITFVADPDGSGPATGSMRVLSPATTSTSAPGTPARCYNTATPANEQTISPVPPVIYVQDGPCGPVTPPGFPVVTGETTGEASLTTQYACGNGHAFVSGVLSGRVTIGTSRDVVITGNTRYQNGVTGSDALGLIPEGSAWIYHPVRLNSSGQWENILTWEQTVRRVDAAILSVDKSFLVQNWRLGPALDSDSVEVACLPENLDTVAGCSKLTVRGSIIQRFRGPVGSAATSTRPRSGYLKNYIYDERLRNAPPPFFLQPKDSWRLHLVTD